MKIRTFAKLGDICDVSAGQGAPQGDSNYCDNGTPFVKAGNLIELIQGKKETEIQKVSEDVAKKHKLKKYPAGSLLFAKSGMSCMKGYVYQLKNDSYVVSHLAIVKPKKDSSDYIEYCLRHIKPNSLVKDEAYPSISLQDISNLEIPLPSLEEQVKIADQLSKCTQIINKHKEQLEKYDFLIKSRFIEMFGDSVTNSKNWNLKKLGDLLESIRYGTSTPPVFSETGYAFIRATNIKKGKIVNDDMKYISEEEAKKISKCKLNGNEILIVRSGVNSGDTCVVTKEYINQYAGYDMILVLGNQINPIYLNELLNTNYMEKMIKPLTRRAAQPHLNSEQTQSLPIILPPLSLQNDFAAFVHQIDKSKFEIWLYLNLCYIIEKRVFTYD